MIRTLSNTQIEEFAKYLKSEEKSRNTIDKYVRDARAFAEYANGREITKDIVVAYKHNLQRKYAVGSVNSMLAALNSLLAFSGRRDLKIKSVKFQRRIFFRRKGADKSRICKIMQSRRRKKQSAAEPYIADHHRDGNTDKRAEIYHG